jgi:hypothetical protein
MTLGSSVVNINSFSLLLAALAPIAWPAPASERVRESPAQQATVAI